MRQQLKMLGAATGLALVSGCVTYPYEDGFAACDRAAGQCYRGCEDSYGGPGGDRCRQDCDFSANRCFDAAYDPYRSSYGGGYGYGYPSPWRGSYGYWYPDRGYIFSFDYYGGSRYGRSPYYGGRHPYRDDRDRRGRRGGGYSGGGSGGGGGTYTPPPGGGETYTPPARGGRGGPRGGGQGAPSLSDPAAGPGSGSGGNYTPPAAPPPPSTGADGPDGPGAGYEPPARGEGRGGDRPGYGGRDREDRDRQPD